MQNNTDFFNITYDALGTPTIEATISQVFNSLQSSLLMSILYVQIFFLILTIGTIRVTDPLANNVSWGKLWDDSTKPQDRNLKIVNAIAYISLMPAIFGVLLCISVKMELNL